MRTTLKTAFLTSKEIAGNTRVSIRKLAHQTKGSPASRHTKLGGKVLLPIEKEVRHG